MSSVSDHFTHYLALGDSISIDVYPGMAHMEAVGQSFPTPGLGAASLFFRNDDSVWPDFSGQDLERLWPAVGWSSLCLDGATTAHVLEEQLPAIDLPGDERALVTLTAGGNDLLGLLLADEETARAESQATAQRLQAIVDGLRRALPRSLILVSTVYDPTDATGQLGPVEIPPDRMSLLTTLNDALRRLARGPGRLLADLHAHFAGHGRAAEDDEDWYWRHLTIEPGLRGASEVRRVWLDALRREDLC